MNLTFRNVRAFVAIARFGTFTDAAEHLLLSQPALTASIRQLEEMLGVRLFDRTPRGVSLTVEGKEFLPAAERLLADADAAVLSVRSLAERRRGSVGIASVASFANRILSVAIPQFTEAFPGISVRLRIADSVGVHRMIAENIVDFGFAGRAEGDLALRSTLLTADPVGLICRADHPLVGMPEPERWQHAPRYPFIGVANGEVISTALTGASDIESVLSPPKYEIENLVVLVAMLRAGLSVSAVPAMTFPDHEPDLAFLPMAAPVVRRQIHFITHSDRSLSRAAETMKRQIEETAQTLLADDNWLALQMRHAEEIATI